MLTVFQFSKVKMQGDNVRRFGCITGSYALLSALHPSEYKQFLLEFVTLSSAAMNSTPRCHR